ncbi:MAG: hypothetical protein V7720_00660 [Halioglobus sp.]
MTIELQKMLQERDMLDEKIRKYPGLGGRGSLVKNFAEYLAARIVDGDVRGIDRPGRDIRIVKDGKRYCTVAMKWPRGGLVPTQFRWLAKPGSFDALVFILFDSDWSVKICKAADLSDIEPYIQRQDEKWTLAHRDLESLGVDSTDLAREIWAKDEPDNLFEELCSIGTTNKWCWWAGCTTCGQHDLRSALRDAVNGVPIKLSYEHLRRPPRLSPPERQGLAELCARADLKNIAMTSTFPDWLGFMGIALNSVGGPGGSGRPLRKISASWTRQFSEMVEPSSQAALRLKTLQETRQDVFTFTDLELMEHGMQAEYQRGTSDGRV